MNYLKYVEHDAENLQFYLWFRDYVRRFDKLPAKQQALSPLWQPTTRADISLGKPRESKIDQSVSVIFRGTDFEKESPLPNREHVAWTREITSSDEISIADKQDGVQTPSELDKRSIITENTNMTTTREVNLNPTAKVTEAFEEAGVQWKPFTTLPFRQEVDRIIAIYIATDAPRQLNLSDREQSSVLKALQHTTHPSAFTAAIKAVEWTLRRQSHPNFVRSLLTNSSSQRLKATWCLIAVVLFLSLTADIILTLSSLSRLWRLTPWIGYHMVISMGFAANKGMCILLSGLKSRHIKPWELFNDESEISTDEKELQKCDSNDPEACVREGKTELWDNNRSNKFEHEPWIIADEKRGMFRGVFAKQIKVKEPALAQMQLYVSMQALTLGIVGGGIIVAIFCAFPKGNLF